MMSLSEVFLIAFVCAAANHFGLVAAAERLVKRSLYPVSCVKCCAFWATMLYGLAALCAAGDMLSCYAAVVLMAASLLAAWTAVWMELAMGVIDVIYLKVYDAIYPAAAGEHKAAAEQ